MHKQLNCGESVASHLRRRCNVACFHAVISINCGECLTSSAITQPGGAVVMLRMTVWS